jgi:hypothetical protein
LDLKGESNRRVEKIHNEEFCNLYSSPVSIRKINAGWVSWAGHASAIEEMHVEALVG